MNAPNAVEYNQPDFTIPSSQAVPLADTLAVRAGDVAPPFDAFTLAGERFRFSDAAEDAHVVLMIGSITSPMTAINLPEMNRLHRSFSPSVRFYLLYTRESHPGEHYSHHTSLEQKLRYATDLKQLEQVEFDVIVDDLEGTGHQRYGLWPNPVFVISRERLIVYRSSLVEPSGLLYFLDKLSASDAFDREPDQAPPHPVYSEHIVDIDVDEATHTRVYERAGPKAFEDVWKLYPSLRDKWPRKIS